MRQLIQQRGRFDCGVACLAMLLDTTYEAALAALGRDPNSTPQALLDAVGDGFPAVGVMGPEVLRICWRLDIAAIHVYSEEAYRDSSPWLYKILTEHGDLAPAYPTMAFVSRHIEGGGTAMLGVKSLNFDDREHWIVASDCKFYDPTTLEKKYEWGTTIPVHEAILLRGAT